MIEITAITPFKSTIYTTELHDVGKLVDVVLQTRKERPNNPEISNRGGWQSGMLHGGDYPIIDKIIDEIIPLITKVYNELGMEGPAKLYGYWMNINKKYNYNTLHNHSGAFISAVLYLKVPKNSGNIVFERTDNLRDCIMIDYVTDHNWGEYYVNSYPGQLLIFPSYMKHRVDQNLSEDDDDERISIAFNFR